MNLSGRYLLSRLTQAAAVLAVAISVVFLVGNVVGDPVDIMLPQEASAEDRARLREQLGFSDSLGSQAVGFVRRATSGFGDSLWQNRSSMEIVIERIPNTMFLAAVAAAMALAGGLLLGIGSALKPHSGIDKSISVFSLGGVSVVEFWLGLVLILVFAVELKLLPTGGTGGFSYVLLPAITVAYRSMGRISQLTRNALLREYSSDYVEMLRAKGLSEPLIFARAFRNAVVGVVMLAGDEVATMMNGAIVVETVFAWRGLGSLLLEAISLRDLFVVEATVFTITLIVIVVNLLTDILYVQIEPKAIHR